MTKHILFIDESGTHDMSRADRNWPVFILVGLLVGEHYYARSLVPRVKAFKRAQGLAPNAVLHSRKIRRWEEDFCFLSDPAARQRFYHDLNSLISGMRMRLFAVVVDKPRLKRHYLVSVNPYDISMSQLLSCVCGTPGMPSLYRPNVVRIVAESRGKVEDKQLQGEYQRFRQSGLSNYGAPQVVRRRPRTVRRVFPQRVDFVSKSKVVAGLELADLAAYPIGRGYVNQDWGSPAYRVIAGKLRSSILFPKKNP